MTHFYFHSVTKRRLIGTWEEFPERQLRPPFLIPFVFAYYRMCGMPVTSVTPF